MKQNLSPLVAASVIGALIIVAAFVFWRAAGASSSTPSEIERVNKAMGIPQPAVSNPPNTSTR